MVGAALKSNLTRWAFPADARGDNYATGRNGSGFEAAIPIAARTMPPAQQFDFRCASIVDQKRNRRRMRTSVKQDFGERECARFRRSNPIGPKRSV